MKVEPAFSYWGIFIEIVIAFAHVYDILRS